MKSGKRGAYDWRQKTVRSRSWLHCHGTAPYQYYSGHVATSLGYVLIYSQGNIEGSRALPVSRYSAMIGGFEYSWSEDVARGPRGLAIMARKFIERLHAEVGQ